jgi:hypothetical protein
LSSVIFHRLLSTLLSALSVSNDKQNFDSWFVRAP